MIKEYSTKDIDAHNIYALIVGKSGAGKTYAIGTLPEKKTLILSAESGMLTLAGRDFDVWTISSVGDLIEAYGRLKNGVDYKNIAIDSLTEISDVCFNALKPGYNKKQTFALYEEFSSRMIDIVKKFRDLDSYNIFVTCLLKEKEDGSEILDVAQKSLGVKLPSFFDFTFLVKSFDKDGKTVRALVSDNTVLDFLKSRSNKISEYEKVDLANICEKVLTKR